MDNKIKYYLEIADNALILSHRLAENCSRGPFLEEDLACTNVALDLIGFAESVYNEAAKLKGDGSTGDDLAYKRAEYEYFNTYIVEQPNTDFAHLMVRQFLVDTFNYYFLAALSNSSDEFLASVSRKSLKEVTYHLRRSSEWMIRLGQGTETSNQKAQSALDTLVPFTDEMFISSDADLELRASNLSVDLDDVKHDWVQKVKEILYLAGLTKTEERIINLNGKNGFHSEHLGFMLADMQYLPNKYPNATW